MSNKDLIINLIQQDLKHCQLILGLDDLGLEASDKHSLEMFDIIADLMQVPEGHIESDWARVYLAYMSESREVEIEHMTTPMRPYAISCYDDLCEVLKNAS
jgi:hypothetical protein